jgi:hypothetical protein
VPLAFLHYSIDRLQKLRNEKRHKEREKKEMEASNRRHLANMRVVQKNLVYVIGLSSKFACEEVISLFIANSNDSNFVIKLSNRRNNNYNVVVDFHFVIIFVASLFMVLPVL